MKRLTRSLAVGIAILCTSSVQARPERPTFADFRLEISAHRERVLIGAERIYAGLPQYFPTLESLPPEIRQKLIHTFMSLHDLPKVMTKQQLAKLGYRAPETLLRSLYEVYGLHLEPKPAFIQALNDIETALKLREIGKILAEIDVSYHAGIWHELKLLERASDVTDTKINRAEELGFVYRPFDSEKFLREAGENMAAFLSHWYEKTFQLRPVAFCRSSQARLGSSK